MSGTGDVTAEFAGEARDFRIRLGELRRIEAKCGDAIGDVLRRLARCALVVSKVEGIEAYALGVEVRADDVREVIYQGLVGRGMPSGDATRLIATEIDDRGLKGILDNAVVALRVLTGTQETPPGEPPAGESPATPASASTSSASTA